LFITCARCEFARYPERGSKPASIVPISDHPFAIGWDSLTHDRLVDVVGRPEPLGAVALLADEALRAVDERRAPGRAIRVVHKACVERRVQGERSVAQRTIVGARIEIGPETGEAIYGRCGGRLFGWKNIGGVSRTNKPNTRQRSQNKRSHESPRTPGFCQKAHARKTKDGSRPHAKVKSKALYVNGYIDLPQHESPAILAIMIAY
jgi:hypothetical protein